MSIVDVELFVGVDDVIRYPDALQRCPHVLMINAGERRFEVKKNNGASTAFEPNLHASKVDVDDVLCDESVAHEPSLGP